MPALVQAPDKRQAITSAKVEKYSWHLNSSPPSAAYMRQFNWVNIGSGDGLSPVRRQAITWTNAALLSIGPLWTNVSEIWI